MPRVCAKCGRVISPDESGCKCTTARRHDWLHSRETILLVTFAALAVAFVATALAARVYHDARRALAESWLQQGSEDLRSNRPSAALSDLQTALIYARQDVPEAQQQAYSLNLAQALVDNHRLDEAHAYLLDLWERTPDSAKLNLELAHLAVGMGDDSEARRYYANAIYGIWDGSSQQVQKNQRDTQLEFCRYLIDRGDQTAAQSVLLAVAASLPPDPALHAQVGGMMLEAGANDPALEQFQEALEADRRNHEALVGAGLASFARGDDRGAVRYLGQASREKPQPGQTAALDLRASRDLSIATADLTLGTFVPGLTTQERARRSEQSYNAAEARLRRLRQELGRRAPKAKLCGCLVVSFCGDFVVQPGGGPQRHVGCLHTGAEDAEFRARSRSGARSAAHRFAPETGHRAGVRRHGALRASRRSRGRGAGENCTTGHGAGP